MARLYGYGAMVGLEGVKGGHFNNPVNTFIAQPKEGSRGGFRTPD